MTERLPDALAEALRQLAAAGIPLDGASDHGVSQALYLREPDDDGVKLYCDRPREVWPRTPESGLVMFTRRFGLNGLLKEAEPESNAPMVEEGPRDF